ncbi:DUF378 domain-containing protein [Microbacterium marinilacus]|uniref:DUF378 domain-containing protein n=1 Tax=Microbacterium marinilacus TaxID=415209 RepID=A0ABP7BCA0_9MICO|nr:DUF378 domain-containing protein [Microbacterium marinilacus]MBY0686995.1 DUF378 domain-containing protein [Microbacterium marinilacus]
MAAVLIAAKIITIIGGLNWGLIGVFDYNVVDGLLGEGSVASRILYVVVGVAAVVTVVDLFTARYIGGPGE